MSVDALHSDVAARVTLGRWLQTQKEAILPVWISAVHTRPAAYVQGVEVPAVVEDTLHDIYNGLAIALEVGRYTDLEQSAQAFVKTHRPIGYSMGSLLGILRLLKENLWLAITAAFPADQVLLQLHGLDAVFSHLEAQVSLSYLALTEQAMREELEQTQWRLEKLDRTKSDFISIAAHELKTPLTLIQGYADILNIELAHSLNERRRNVLAGLAAGLQRLNAIVQDMIAVSMIDNEVLTLHYQPVLLHQIVRTAVRDLQADSPDRQLAINVEGLQDIPTFYADPQRLYVVFNHIIGNSIKYTPDGGRITVSARMLAPGSESDIRFVQVSIADTGIGIAPEDHERIFDKFYGVTEPMRHSSGRTKFKGGGPGLGLAVAKGIIDAHGGKIWVESPGYDEQRCPGSTFHFVLPLYSQPPEPTRGQERLGFGKRPATP